jgi:hypothetical protein
VLYGAGTVQNAAGTLTNASTVQLAGDMNKAGTPASTGTLLFGSTANQVFMPGAATVATLLNNTGAVGARALSLPAEFTVTTGLMLQSGLLRTAPWAPSPYLTGPR